MSFLQWSFAWRRFGRVGMHSLRAESRKSTEVRYPGERAHGINGRKEIYTDTRTRAKEITEEARHR
jgi:hypothetical protein